MSKKDEEAKTKFEDNFENEVTIGSAAKDLIERYAKSVNKSPLSLSGEELKAVIDSHFNIEVVDEWTDEILVAPAHVLKKLRDYDAHPVFVPERAISQYKRMGYELVWNGSDYVIAGRIEKHFLMAIKNDVIRRREKALLLEQEQRSGKQFIDKKHRVGDVFTSRGYHKGHDAIDEQLGNIGQFKQNAEVEADREMVARAEKLGLR